MLSKTLGFFAGFIATFAAIALVQALGLAVAQAHAHRRHVLRGLGLRKPLQRGEAGGGSSGAAGGMVEAGAGLGIGMMLPQMMSQQKFGNTTVVTAATFCTKCGRGLRDEDRFCGGCGQPADPAVGIAHDE